MGILSDTLEDNKELVGQLLSVTFSRRSRGAGEAAPLLLLPCPLCACRYNVEQELQSHILKAHGRLQAYLKVNDQVIQDLSYLEESIEHLLLVALGECRASVRLSLDEEVLREVEISPGRPEELAPLIPEGFYGVLKLEVRLNGATKQYLIYNRTQPPITVGPLNRMVSALQRPLLEGKEPSWSDFQTNCLSAPDINFLEHRYLSGFYEYVLGSFLETKQDRHAGGHFERCYGCLRPFATTLAHTARCVLGIKMNWFHLFDGCGPRSIFYHARLFFMEAGSALTESTAGHSSLRLGDPLGLYVDPFTERLLMAIECFYHHDYSRASALARQLEDSQSGLNRNDEDKLWLLRARVHLAQGAHGEAVNAFRHLEHHPLFGQEAERFL